MHLVRILLQELLVVDNVKFFVQVEVSDYTNTLFRHGTKSETSMIVQLSISAVTARSS